MFHRFFRSRALNQLGLLPEGRLRKVEELLHRFLPSQLLTRRGRFGIILRFWFQNDGYFGCGFLLLPRLLELVQGPDLSASLSPPSSSAVEAVSS